MKRNRTMGTIILFVVIGTLLMAGALLITSGWPNSSENVTSSQTTLTQLGQAATNAMCADTMNDIYVIDDEFAFWVRSGSYCADASYAFTLYDLVTGDILCSVHDSIGGPQETCKSNYQDLFDILKSNTGEEDLGLGTDHKVEKVFSRPVNNPLPDYKAVPPKK